VGTAEVGTVEMGTVEAGTVELGGAEVGVAELRTAEIGTAEVSTDEADTVKVGMVELGDLFIRPSPLIPLADPVLSAPEQLERLFAIHDISPCDCTVSQEGHDCVRTSPIAPRGVTRNPAARKQLLGAARPSMISGRSGPARSVPLQLTPERAMHLASRFGNPQGMRPATALSLLVFFGASGPAFASGRLGHRVISRLAENIPTPPATAAFVQLLEPSESLADGSLSADENRGRPPKTAPWHYVDVPLDEPKYDSRFSGDVSSMGCVVDEIKEFRLLATHKSRSVEERRFALRFLVHCIEDLHVPLHVGDKSDKEGKGNRTWNSRLGVVIVATGRCNCR